MTYEAKVADLNAAPETLVEDVEPEPARARKRRILIAAAVVVALLIGGALLFYGGEEEAVFPPQEGEQVPTVTVVVPGRTTVAGTIHATGTIAARRPMPV